MPVHIRIPHRLYRNTGYIAEPPLSDVIGQNAVRDFKYLNHWAQNYQLFSFWQPAFDVSHGDQSGSGSTYVEGYYYVILCSPPKKDTSNPDRFLHGALLPWASYADQDHPGDWDSWPQIYWQQYGDPAETLLWETHADSGIESIDTVNNSISENMRLHWQDTIQLGGNGIFTYTPDAGGEFTYGRIHTIQIRTASLGVWPGPDWELTAAQAQFNTDKFQAGHGIRGYTTTAAKNSLGNLIHTLGTGTITDDDVYQNGRRTCLFSWGHPQGVYQNNILYEHISGNSSVTYKVPPRAWAHSSYSASTYTARVAMVQTTSNNGGDVKIISQTAADTLTARNYNATAGAWPDLITTDSVSSADLEIDLATAGDKITIETRASSSSEITLHSLAIYDKESYS